MKVAAIIITGMLLFIGLLAYPIAFFIVDPSFSVHVQRLPSGDYRFEIDPNFVVNSVYRVTITGPDGQLAELNQPQEGVQHVLVSGNTPPGTTVNIDCSLQYDRIAPCITDSRKTVALP